jgi:hypothetical protein
VHGVFRRQALAYALGLGTAVAGFGVAAAWAGHTAGGGTVLACVRHESGTLYLQNTRSRRSPCERGDTATQWSVTGPQGPQGAQGPTGAAGANGAPGAPGAAGPAGSLNSATSPNGLFTITLSDQGILLRGPNGKVTVDLAGARMNTIEGATP